MLNNANVQWDIAPSDEFILSMRDKTEAQVIWGGNYFNLPPCRALLVWDKRQPWPNFSQVEVAWTNLSRPAALFKHDKSNIDGKSHPTQKPLALFRWCLSFAPDAITILDPFSGSGTIGLAAKLEGRKATLIELDERYCEITADRLSQGVLF